ncbi:MAG: DUF5069 domain-containing protein [Chthoniobacteraceae bacterium]|nr:DUF5069 domain-containing protein [Chthoniobacteraceae bacterium]
MKSTDLTQHPPRSPRVRIRDYAILARAIDKARAELAGKGGEYHYDCPLDRTLFTFKGVTGEEFLAQVKRERSDEELGIWLDMHGLAKTPEEICAWSDSMEGYCLYNNLEKRPSFVLECTRLGLNPARTTLFEWLEADDRASFSVTPARR